MPPLGNLRTTTHYKGKEYSDEAWLKELYKQNQQSQQSEVVEISETTEPAPVPPKKRKTTAVKDDAIEAANTKDLKEKNIH